MKYAIAILGILAMVFSAGQVSAAEAKSGSTVKTSATSVEGTNLLPSTDPAVPDKKPVKKAPKKRPKKKASKKPAKPKIVKPKPAHKKKAPTKKNTAKPKTVPKKAAPKKAVKKPAKKNPAKPKTQKVINNATEVEKAAEGALAGPLQPIAPGTEEDPASAKPSGGKVTAIAGVAGLTSIGLLMFLKKLFWH